MFIENPWVDSDPRASTREDLAHIRHSRLVELALFANVRCEAADPGLLPGIRGTENPNRHSAHGRRGAGPEGALQKAWIAGRAYDFLNRLTSCGLGQAGKRQTLRPAVRPRADGRMRGGGCNKSASGARR